MSTVEAPALPALAFKDIVKLFIVAPLSPESKSANTPVKLQVVLF
jgi:hypothetical protein